MDPSIQDFLARFLRPTPCVAPLRFLALVQSDSWHGWRLGCAVPRCDTGSHSASCPAMWVIVDWVGGSTPTAWQSLDAAAAVATHVRQTLQGTRGIVSLADSLVTLSAQAVCEAPP